MTTATTTIVSAFISNVNSREDRKLEEYISYGIKLMGVNIPKIIFLDKTIISSHPEFRLSSENTCIIPIDKTDIYMYQFIGQITNFELREHNPKKDTIEYILLQCNKTEFIREAIASNPFQTDQFIWIDFGIFHMYQENETMFYKSIDIACHKRYENIRMASLWNVHEPLFYQYNNVKIDIYKDIAWFFSGSVFGGEKESLIRFADLAREKYRKIIHERGHIMWEINVWYLIWQDVCLEESRELMDLYYGDHNYTILYEY
jgi:hypothetical protein